MKRVLELALHRAVACGDLIERELRRRAIRRLGVVDHVVDQSRHSNHEKLVEVVGVDHAKANPLQQWHGGVGSQRQHAMVERQPRDLAIEQTRLRGIRIWRTHLVIVPTVGDCRSRACR